MSPVFAQFEPSVRRSVGRPAKRCGPRGAWGFVLVALSACSPALDWRELRPDGAHVRASMPCRPASHQRELPLAGAPVTLSLWACQVDTGTFGLAMADMRDPARVGPALLALREAARQNVQGRVIELVPVQVPGMTPKIGRAHV